MRRCRPVTIFVNFVEVRYRYFDLGYTNYIFWREWLELYMFAVKNKLVVDIRKGSSLHSPWDILRDVLLVLLVYRGCEGAEHCFAMFSPRAIFDGIWIAYRPS